MDFRNIEFVVFAHNTFWWKRRWMQWTSILCHNLNAMNKHILLIHAKQHIIIWRTRIVIHAVQFITKNWLFQKKSLLNTWRITGLMMVFVHFLIYKKKK